MAVIAETVRPLPQETRQPSHVSRRWFLKAGLAAAGTTTALGTGALYIPPRGEIPVRLQAGNILSPGSIELRVKAPLIVYPLPANGGDALPPKGPTAFLSEVVYTHPLVYEITRYVVKNQYDNVALNSFSLGDSLQNATTKALALLEELPDEPETGFNPILEAIHFSLIPLTILATAPWFSSGQLSLYGFPVQSFYDLRAKNTVELYSQPGEKRHQIVASFYAFMYAYSVHYGLDLHTSIPGFMRWLIIKNRLSGKYPTELDEAVDFAEIAGDSYEISTLANPRNLPIINPANSIPEGPFANDIREDEAANRVGAEMGVQLFADAVKGKPLAEILERYNQAVGVAA